MMEIVFRPRAQLDIDSIAIYIGVVQSAPKASSALTERLLGRIDLLGQFPNMGSPCETKGTVHHDYRILVVDNYRVFYRVTDEQVVVCRIIHARRDIDDYDILDI